MGDTRIVTWGDKLAFVPVVQELVGVGTIFLNAAKSLRDVGARAIRNLQASNSEKNLKKWQEKFDSLNKADKSPSTQKTELLRKIDAEKEIEIDSSSPEAIEIKKMHTLKSEETQENIEAEGQLPKPEKIRVGRVEYLKAKAALNDKALDRHIEFLKIGFKRLIPFYGTWYYWTQCRKVTNESDKVKNEKDKTSEVDPSAQDKLKKEAQTKLDEEQRAAKEAQDKILKEMAEKLKTKNDEADKKRKQDVVDAANKIKAADEAVKAKAQEIADKKIKDREKAGKGAFGAITQMLHDKKIKEEHEAQLNTKRTEHLNTENSAIRQKAMSLGLGDLGVHVALRFDDILDENDENVNVVIDLPVFYGNYRSDRKPTEVTKPTDKS